MRDPLVYLFDDNNDLMRVQPNGNLVCLADSTVNTDESSDESDMTSYAPSYSCDLIVDSSMQCQATSCKYNRCNCKEGFTQDGLNCQIASEPIETVSIDLISSVPFQTEFPFNSTDISSLTENIKKDFASLLGLISLDGNVSVNARNIKVEHVEAGPNGMATFYLSLNLETECVQSECSAVEDTVKVSTESLPLQHTVCCIHVCRVFDTYLKRRRLRALLQGGVILF